MYCKNRNAFEGYTLVLLSSTNLYSQGFVSIDAATGELTLNPFFY